jgi:hypothetical protein
LPYPIYFVGTYVDAHVRMFQKAIQGNGEKWDVDIVNLFCFTLRDEFLECGEYFIKFHLGCIFLELEATLCKRYRTIQNDE